MTEKTTKKQATVGQTQPTTWRIEGHSNLFGVESSSVTFRFYRVSRNAYGELRCCGHNDGDRCWPFYQHGVCKHTQAVETFLDSEKASAPKPVVIDLDRWAAKQERKLKLQDLFELSERTSRIEMR